jgi:hypothetical protein
MRAHNQHDRGSLKDEADATILVLGHNAAIIAKSLEPLVKQEGTKHKRVFDRKCFHADCVEF